jgi:hypothetical protein
MRILEAIIADVRPPRSKPSGVWLGLHWTAVASKYTGMAHTFKSGEAQSIRNGGKLSSSSLKDLCRLALSDNTLEASVGCAALNSQLEPRGRKGNIESQFRKLAKGKCVSIIGRFPFNDDVRKLASKCHILELNPVGDELPSTMADDVLPKCDLNIITATTLINHTLDRLLELGSGGKNIVLGPTTPFSDVLFERGADILAGVRVTDTRELASSITQGVKKFREIGGIEPLFLSRS